MYLAGLWTPWTWWELLKHCVVSTVQVILKPFVVFLQHQCFHREIAYLLTWSRNMRLLGSKLAVHSEVWQGPKLPWAIKLLAIYTYWMIAIIGWGVAIATNCFLEVHVCDRVPNFLHHKQGQTILSVVLGPVVPSVGACSTQHRAVHGFNQTKLAATELRVTFAAERIRRLSWRNNALGHSSWKQVQPLLFLLLWVGVC